MLLLVLRPNLQHAHQRSLVYLWKVNLTELSDCVALDILMLLQERENETLHPLGQQWPMRTNLFYCLGLCTKGQYDSRDSLLVLVPRSKPHGTVHIIKELCKFELEAI